MPIVMTCFSTSGAFPSLKVDIEFNRRVGIYLVNTYVPSILSVVMSWVSTWLTHSYIKLGLTIYFRGISVPKSGH